MLGKKKVWLIVGIIIAAAVVLSVFLGIYANSPEKKVQEKLELGQKYLSALEYEKAIGTFVEAYNIEPSDLKIQEEIANAYLKWSASLAEQEKFEEAIQRLDEACEILVNNVEQIDKLKENEVQCYLAWSDIYVEKEEYEEALDILREGYEKLQDGRLESRSQEVEQLLEEKRLREEKEAKLKAQVEAITVIAKKIQEAAENEDYETIFRQMGSVEFQDVLNNLNDIGLVEPYIVDIGDRKVGFYPVCTESYGEAMVYYGDYAGDIRQGQGVWLGYKDGEYYYAQGSWAEDKPHGEQYVREWNEQLDSSVVVRVIEGSVDGGLWHGQVSWGFEESEGFVAWYVTFEQGLFIVLQTLSDGVGIVSETPYTVYDSNVGSMGIESYNLTIKNGIEGFQ